MGRPGTLYEFFGRREKNGFSFLPPGVACIINGEVITKAEARRNRKEYHRRQLEVKRYCYSEERTIPAVLWVFYNPHWIYSGWWCYLYGRDRMRDEWSNFRYGQLCDWRLQKMLMELFPLGILPLEGNFRDWMKAFTKTYPTLGKHKVSGKQFVYLKLYNQHIKEIKLKAR